MVRLKISNNLLNPIENADKIEINIVLIMVSCTDDSINIDDNIFIIMHDKKSKCHCVMPLLIFFL